MARNPLSSNPSPGRGIHIPGLSTLGGQLSTVGDSAIAVGKLIHRAFNKNLRQGEEAVRRAGHNARWAEQQERNFTNRAMPQAIKNEVRGANQELNRSITELGFARKKFGASFKGMIVSIGDVFRLNTGKWFSGKIQGTTNEAIEKALGMHGNVAERMLSKPFRVIAHHPRVALAALVAGGIALVGGNMRKEAADRTQNEALGELANANAVNAQANSYQITAEDYAAMQARMRGGEGPQGGHAERLAAVAAQQPAMPEPGQRP